jgi:hypothetical protein
MGLFPQRVPNAIRRECCLLGSSIFVVPTEQEGDGNAAIKTRSRDMLFDHLVSVLLR